MQAANDAYFQEDQPIMDDAAYDAKRQRLVALEEAFPELKETGGVSDKVGARPSGKFAKIRHRVPMLSLDNAFSDEAVAEFVQRVHRFLGRRDDEPIAFTAEPKIDGLSLSLRYEKGALVHAVRFRPDVVLVDIGLPKMDGYEVVKELRRRPETRGALMIAVTGFGAESDIRKSEEAGFDDHLGKPVDPTRLVAAVAAVAGETANRRTL